MSVLVNLQCCSETRTKYCYMTTLRDVTYVCTKHITLLIVQALAHDVAKLDNDSWLKMYNKIQATL